MTFSSNLRRGFNGFAVTLMLGLANEAAHAIHHAPQPHTDSHEQIACQMERLREAQGYRNVHKAAATGFNLKPRSGGKLPPIPAFNPDAMG
jgi:hypothetical protein